LEKLKWRWNRKVLPLPLLRMSTSIYSRSYLQSLPEKHKQEHIELMIREFVHNVNRCATMGKTSCLYSIVDDSARRHRNHLGMITSPHQPSPPEVTTEDLIAAFQNKFPGCTITYEENWVETTPNTKTLTKGILVDWS
jgi:hypothetical protein